MQRKTTCAEDLAAHGWGMTVDKTGCTGGGGEGGKKGWG